MTNGPDPWAALGDPTRRAIFERLAARPSAVGELAEGLPVSRPAVSQHLKVLKEAGLIIEEPVGTRRIYRVNTDGVGRLRADVGRFWSSALAAYKTLVEAPKPTGGLMTMQAQATAVRHEIVVAAPLERAFTVFTEDFGRIKPREHNLLG